MYIVNRLKRSLANRKADVFLRSELQSFGSPAQVSRALTELQKDGVLVKLIEFDVARVEDVGAVYYRLLHQVFVSGLTGDL